MTQRFAATFVALGLTCALQAQAGPFTDPAVDASERVEGATDVTQFTPGLVDPDDPGGGTVGSAGTEFTLGPPATPGDDVKPLGNLGSITLEFEGVIHDGEGQDFAVFENGFFSVNGCFCAHFSQVVSAVFADFLLRPASGYWP